MVVPIELSEHEDWSGDLNTEDAQYVLDKLAPDIAIRRDVRTDRYVLNPNQFVGVATLPSGRRLESRPKVAVRNVFRMLAIALDLPVPFRDELARYAALDELLDFVVAYFAELVEDRVAHGLYRSYVEQEDNLAAVRGRIAIAEDLRRNYATRHRTYCRYTEFTWDIPENQIVRQVVHLLAGWGFRPALQQRLDRLDATLAEVTPTRLPATAIDQFSYHRLNEDYRPLHQFCRLFLEGASLSEERGPIDFQTFLVDMNKLFEAFITQLLRSKLRNHLILDAQRQITLDRHDRVSMQPDIVLHHNARPALIADCKYKRLAPQEFKHHDVYQLLAYCTATRAQRGALVYPRHLADVADEVCIRNATVVVRQLTLDLGQEGAAFDAECDTFARTLFAWAVA